MSHEIIILTQGCTCACTRAHTHSPLLCFLRPWLEITGKYLLDEKSQGFWEGPSPALTSLLTLLEYVPYTRDRRAPRELALSRDILRAGDLTSILQKGDGVRGSRDSPSAPQLVSDRARTWSLGPLDAKTPAFNHTLRRTLQETFPWRDGAVETAENSLATLLNIWRARRLNQKHTVGQREHGHGRTCCSVQAASVRVSCVFSLSNLTVFFGLSSCMLKPYIGLHVLT